MVEVYFTINEEIKDSNNYFETVTAKHDSEGNVTNIVYNWKADNYNDLITWPSLMRRIWKITEEYYGYKFDVDKFKKFLETGDDRLETLSKKP